MVQVKSELTEAKLGPSPAESMTLKSEERSPVAGGDAGQASVLETTTRSEDGTVSERPSTPTVVKEQETSERSRNGKKRQGTEPRRPRAAKRPAKDVVARLRKRAEKSVRNELGKAMKLALTAAIELEERPDTSAPGPQQRSFLLAIAEAGRLLVDERDQVSVPRHLEDMRLLVIVSVAVVNIGHGEDLPGMWTLLDVLRELYEMYPERATALSRYDFLS
ncbi:hypothetical protein PHYPSEUDO_004642 [Phytophthora pseudosyringae]|uniref:Uncharacterized protein n=1 Tax=Phytophthora pseudosyringae TaxID=221518 RepID=A0A8T1VMZ8_9STRA|nr:hypothetical protein PHYPSEUDO_004642 [Phytophthora pseudosyringae]